MRYAALFFGIGKKSIQEDYLEGQKKRSHHDSV